MIRLILARHGETLPNRRGVLLGRDDPGLTDRGRSQAQALAAWVADHGVTRVVSSPLGRCRDTAVPIAEMCSLDVVTDDRLVELDYGDWEGRSFADIPDDASARWRSDARFRPPGGESLADVQERVGDWCRELAASDEESTVVAVSHVSPIKAAVVWALAAEPEAAWRMWIEVASVTRLGLRSDGGVLLGFNERAHLDALD